MSSGNPHDSGARPFLTAEWRHIALLNYAAEPSLLEPLLPQGLELDLWKGHAFVSLVGLLFRQVAFLGARLPLYPRYEQVNLRFYVRRPIGCEWRPGVAFVKEFVPHRLLAVIASFLYKQNFEFARMQHRVEVEDDELGVEASSPVQDRPAPTELEYSWFHSGRWNRLGLRTGGPGKTPEAGSFEHFVTERHWGYAAAAKGRLIEFEVRRPAWSVISGDGWLDCDVMRVYGDMFAGILSPEPASALMALGSTVSLSRGVRLIS